MNPRAVAATLLSQVIVEQQSLTAVLNGCTEEKNRPLIQELCYGVLRYYPRLNFLTTLLLTKSLKERDAPIHLLILIGLYQLIYMRIPDHAAVTETVNAVIHFKKKWASHLINGVLRNFLRNREPLLQKLEKEDEAHFSHPQWLIDKIKLDWPGCWERVLEANNQRPPMSLRVNLKKITRKNYINKLNIHNITAQITSYNECGVVLDKPTDINSLPGFFEGEISVQDIAAQMAVTLLELEPGLRILDACAAPGGKTAHILESESQLSKLVILEKDPKRAKKIEENLRRLDLIEKSDEEGEKKIEIMIGDATQPELWWGGDYFDRILLDAPCSATGVIRRHPDIKILRKKEDITKLAELQFQMISHLWNLLKPGGLLIYATCSIMPEENVLNIKRFFEFLENGQNTREGIAKKRVIQADWGIPQIYGRQILPGDSCPIDKNKKQATNMDGFYYCIIEKG